MIYWSTPSLTPIVAMYVHLRNYLLLGGSVGTFVSPHFVKCWETIADKRNLLSMIQP